MTPVDLERATTVPLARLVESPALPRDPGSPWPPVLPLAGGGLADGD